MTSSAPLVCIIILNYNGRRHLEYCLPSVLTTDYPNLHVLVVDNASKDDSVAWMQTHYPTLDLVRAPTNCGWSGGNNLGLARAKELNAQYVILNNNDVKIDPRWVTEAVRAVEQNERVGAVCFRIMEPRGGPEDAGFPQAVKEWQQLAVHEQKHMDGILLLPMAVLDQIGWIDEGFFAYCEDNDLEHRLRTAGYRILGTNIPLWHYGGGYLGQVPLRSAALQMRGDFRLALKHGSVGQVLYEWVRHLAIACTPFLKFSPHDAVKRRLRPSNIFVNFGLWVYATVWNIWHLPQTLQRRRADQQRMMAARKLLNL